jgi:hypothetical protein
MWYRVFVLSETQPVPSGVGAFLQSFDASIEARFHADEHGWFAADIDVPGEETIRLERFLASEEGIRAELNTWAAWLETRENNPHVGRLMQHMISTRQVFTLQDDPTASERAAQTCSELCRFLARVGDGVYQADSQGFLDADGLLLVPEDV